MIDRTGEPRSDRDLLEAIQVINECAVKSVMSLPPRLGVNLMNIKDLLIELCHRRAEE